MKVLRLSLAALSAAFLASCGSVSEVQPVAGASGKLYSNVVVRDFKYTEEEGVDGARSGKAFPDAIAKEIRDGGKFSSVSRQKAVASDALIIEGEVTHYKEGNPMLRLMVGMGAGSSYFDSDVRFVDSKTGKVIATMKADKNSLVLGGGVAAAQTAQSFMIGAAKKVGTEATQFSKSASQS